MATTTAAATAATPAEPTVTVKHQSIVEETVVVSSSDEEKGDDSPPLTSSLFSRNSASSARESAYLRQTLILRWTRLGLSGLSFCLALAVVGCAGHVLYGYNSTRWGLDQLLPLWPADVDLKPTLGTLVPSVIVVVASLAYFIFAVIPSPRSRTLHQIMLFGASSLVAFIAVFFAVVFKQLLFYRSDIDNERDNLQSWTCGFYYGAQDFLSSGNQTTTTTNQQLVPAGFKELCMESQASQWMTVVLFVLELVCCGVALLGVAAEKQIRKSREMRYQAGVTKCESEFK